MSDSEIKAVGQKLDNFIAVSTELSNNLVLQMSEIREVVTEIKVFQNELNHTNDSVDQVNKELVSIRGEIKDLTRQDTENEKNMAILLEAHKDYATIKKWFIGFILTTVVGGSFAIIKSMDTNNTANKEVIELLKQSVESNKKIVNKLN